MLLYTMKVLLDVQTMIERKDAYVRGEIAGMGS